MRESSLKASGPTSDRQGVFFIMLSEALLAIVSMIAKYVHGWSNQKMMLIRSSTDLCLCLAMCAWCSYVWPGWKTAVVLVMRGLCFTAFVFLFWESLDSCLPFGDVNLMVVTLAPTLFVLLAWIQLGEQIPRAWPVQFGLCGVGALLINKPGVPDSACPASTSLLPLAAAFCGSLLNLGSRNVPRDVHPLFSSIFADAVVLMFAVSTGGAFSSHAATSLWPDRIDGNLGLLVAAGVVGWVGLMSDVRGYQLVSVPAVASIAAYISVPLFYTIQVGFFGDPLDAFSAIGAVLITATNVGAIFYQQSEEAKLQAQGSSEDGRHKSTAEEDDMEKLLQPPGSSKDGQHKFTAEEDDVEKLMGA